MKITRKLLILFVSVFVFASCAEEGFEPIPSNFSGEMIYKGQALALDNAVIIQGPAVDSITFVSTLTITNNVRYFVDDSTQTVDSISGIGSGIFIDVYHRDTLGIETRVYNQNDIQPKKRPGAFDEGVVILNADLSLEEPDSTDFSYIRNGRLVLNQISPVVYEYEFTGTDREGNKITVTAKGLTEVFKF